MEDCPSGSCTASSLGSGTDYYLEIQNSGNAAEDFTLTVETGLNQGTVSDPILLEVAVDGEDFEGSVGTGNSYYKVTPPAAWNLDVQISGVEGDINADLTDDGDLYLYSDAAFSTLLNSSAFPGVTAEGTAAGSVTSDPVYLRVDGSKSSAGLSFWLRMTDE